MPEFFDDDPYLGPRKVSGPWKVNGLEDLIASLAKAVEKLGELAAQEGTWKASFLNIQEDLESSLFDLRDIAEA